MYHCLQITHQIQLVTIHSPLFCPYHLKMMESSLLYLSLYRNHWKTVMTLTNYVVSNNWTTGIYILNNILYSFIIILAIGTWFEAFTTPYNPQRGLIPPAYIALEITQSAIEASRFKRDAGGYILNRFVRQVSNCLVQYIAMYVCVWILNVFNMY